MDRKIALATWFFFALLGCASWGVYLFLARMPGHFNLLFGMALLNALVGVWIVMRSADRLRSASIVGIAFVAGQWCTLLWIATFLVWRLNGFAP